MQIQPILGYFWAIFGLYQPPGPPFGSRPPPLFTYSGSAPGRCGCLWGGCNRSKWVDAFEWFVFGGLTARMRIGPIGERGMEKRKGKKLEKETIITLVFRAYIPCIRSEDACEAEKNEKNQEKKQIRKRRATGKGGLKLDHEIGEYRKRCMYRPTVTEKGCSS